MTLEPISKVSKAYGVSTRTLRYYEQLGLIKSSKLPDYAYRAYDEEALARLRQILVLRKLRIPLKQIGLILETRDGQTAIRVFEESIAILKSERQAMETIEGVLRSFVTELEKLLPAPLPPKVFEQQHVVELVQSLSIKTLSSKEEISMEELSQANKTLEKMTNPRIIYLPPMTVAACHETGENKEDAVIAATTAFIKANRLWQIKPDFRRISFNNPASQQTGGSLGYEAWVSIPDNMEVPPPLMKKQFLGGMYAAHTIQFGEFHEWGRFWEWATGNDDYDMDFAPRTVPPNPNADPAFEEQLNAIHHLDDTTPFGTQLDLLLPIRPKTDMKPKGPTLTQQKFCESCGIPLDQTAMFGTNADQSINHDYCVYCFKDGRFTQDVTMEEMIELSLAHMKELFAGDKTFSPEDALKHMRDFFPLLKRWKAQ